MSWAASPSQGALMSEVTWWAVGTPHVGSSPNSVLCPFQTPSVSASSSPISSKVGPEFHHHLAEIDFLF